MSQFANRHHFESYLKYRTRNELFMRDVVGLEAAGKTIIDMSPLVDYPGFNYTEAEVKVIVGKLADATMAKPLEYHP